MAATDESLMAAYQSGDVAAFHELVTRYERPLWVFLRRFVADAATAEDLLQEVFLRVIGAAGAWTGEGRFATWLYTIARNLCTDHARRAAHRQTVSPDMPVRSGSSEDSAPILLERLAGGSDGAAVASLQVGGGQGESAAIDSQLRGKLDRAIDALPVEQREVFIMREVMDLPFAEIARAVGASEPTVKSRMRYALEKLRDTLSAFHDPAAATTTGKPAGTAATAILPGPTRNP